MASTSDIATKLGISEEEVEQILSRLRKEKKESITTDKKLGFDLGFKYATRLSYKCMLKIIDIPDPENDDHLDWLANFDIATHLHKIESKDPKYSSILGMIYYENQKLIDSEVIDREHFYEAFVEGVQKFLYHI